MNEMGIWKDFLTTRNKESAFYETPRYGNSCAIIVLPSVRVLSIENSGEKITFATFIFFQSVSNQFSYQ